MGSKPEEKIEPVDDPGQQRDDDVARERSTSPVPRVGDTWESMDSADERDRNGPRRRVGVLEVDSGQAHVEDKVTRRKSHIAVERFVPPFWRFIG